LDGRFGPFSHFHNALIHKWSVSAQGAWSERRDPAAHLLDNFREARPFGGGEVVHLQALGLDPDFLKNIFYPLDPSSGSEVAFKKMTAAFQASGYHDAVNALLKGG
jgi:hypothetical protein